MRLDPDGAAVFRQPAKCVHTEVAGREVLLDVFRRRLAIVGMDDGQPEVRRGQPLLDAVSEHARDVLAHVVHALRLLVRIAMRFPNHAGNAGDDVGEAPPLTLDVVSKPRRLGTVHGDRPAQHDHEDVEDRELDRVSPIRQQQRMVRRDEEVRCGRGGQRDGKKRRTEPAIRGAEDDRADENQVARAAENGRDPHLQQRGQCGQRNGREVALCERGVLGGS